MVLKLFILVILWQLIIPSTRCCPLRPLTIAERPSKPPEAEETTRSGAKIKRRMVRQRLFLIHNEQRVSSRYGLRWYFIA